ncbi:ferredoxin--NADP reductase, partial [Salmonella enterica]|nr:ferredoxin--NADP reductase [Salmonella enterica]
PFRNQGRITELMENGKLCADIGIPQINPETDRAMICGSPHMLADISAMLDKRGFVVSPGVGQPGDYVVERAFVDK